MILSKTQSYLAFSSMGNESCMGDVSISGPRTASCDVGGSHRGLLKVRELFVPVGLYRNCMDAGKLDKFGSSEYLLLI